MQVQFDERFLSPCCGLPMSTASVSLSPERAICQFICPCEGAWYYVFDQEGECEENPRDYVVPQCHGNVRKEGIVVVEKFHDPDGGYLSAVLCQIGEEDIQLFLKGKNRWRQGYQFVLAASTLDGACGRP